MATKTLEEADRDWEADLGWEPVFPDDYIILGPPGPAGDPIFGNPATRNEPPQSASTPAPIGEPGDGDRATKLVARNFLVSKVRITTYTETSAPSLQDPDMAYYVQTVTTVTERTLKPFEADANHWSFTEVADKYFRGMQGTHTKRSQCIVLKKKSEIPAEPIVTKVGPRDVQAYAHIPDLCATHAAPTAPAPAPAPSATR